MSFASMNFRNGRARFRALEHLEGGGGSAANAAVAIARLGGMVEFWSRVGADATGERILASLEAEGVDTSFILVHEGSRSSELAVIVDRSGERLIVSERDHAMPGDTAWLPLTHIAQAAVVMSDLRWYEATAASFCKARELGVKTLLDIDIGGGTEIAKYLVLTDYAIFSAPALAAFIPEGTDHDRLGRIFEFGVQHAGVTRGSSGYVWHSRSGANGHQPAFSVDVIDLTGAGDAFHGTFAWGLSEGYDDATCALFASAAAALKCRKLGARQALPNRAELGVFLTSADRPYATRLPF